MCSNDQFLLTYFSLFFVSLWLTPLFYAAYGETHAAKVSKRQACAPLLIVVDLAQLCHNSAGVDERHDVLHVKYLNVAVDKP
jgi:hypothetical protein